MDKYCYSGDTQRPQRRINGLQLPLNYQQISAWIVFLITAAFNFFVVQIQFYELKIISIIIYTNLYIFHIFSHLTALILDPAEEDIRKRETYDVPEFDRSIHAHVIENGRCHLCNIYTSNKNTKHCGICNKCVYYFDHHCKWLNNCIGQRNYVAFIICIISAALTALMTASLCLFDITLFFTNSQLFSSEAQNFINCTLLTNTNQNIRYCKNSILFLILLITFFVCATAICCTLLHLLCFHLYITVLGVSTYEYIITTSKVESRRLRCCNMTVNKRLYIVSKKRELTTNRNEDALKTVNARNENNKTSNILQTRNDRSVANLIHILINEEMKKANKSILYERNKVHPLKENQN